MLHGTFYSFFGFFLHEETLSTQATHTHIVYISRLIYFWHRTHNFTANLFSTIMLTFVLYSTPASVHLIS